MAKHILAFDLGTTSTKAVIVDLSGRILGTASHGYETFYSHGTWAEQNPLDWWNAICSLTPEVLAKSGIVANQIACLVVSGKMLGVVPVDRSGRLTRSRNFIFADARSVPQASRFLDVFGHRRFYEITGGSQIPALYPLFKILWLRDNERDVFDSTDLFLQAKGYILHRLTGNFVTDHTDASQSGMFDLKNLVWSKEILDAAEVSIDKLPEIKSPVDVVGRVTSLAAEETSLAAGTPVVAGGGDILCACAGAGVVEQGLFYIHIGSAAWCGTVTTSPVLDFEHRQLCLAHLVPGEYAPHHTMYNGANCEQWIRERLLPDTRRWNDAAEMYRFIEGRAQTVSPGSNKLIFLPYMRGADPPFLDPGARGAFIGLGMDHDERHLYRSVLEGVAFQLRMILDLFLEQGLEVSELRLIGGGAESPLWRQILADVLQRELSIPEAVREAGCLGAAMAGGVGVGLFDTFSDANRMVRVRQTVRPRSQCRGIYDALYDIFRNAYPALKDSCEKLGHL